MYTVNSKGVNVKDTRRSDGRRQRRQRGHPAGLSRDRVVAAALEMIDSEGIDALSMRRLAARLGVEATALYNHVHTKDDLIQAAAVRALAGLTVPDPTWPWRQRVETLVRGLYEILLSHPVLVLHLSRLETGPADPSAIALMEAAIGALAAAGLSPAGQVSAFRGLISMCMGFVMTHTRGLSATKAESEAIWADWDPNKWEKSGLPHLAGLGPQFLANSADDDFDFMLGIYLDALERAGSTST